MRTVRVLLAIAVLTLLGSQAASAKCPYATYTIKGTVVDDLGNPVSGERVLLYFDDDETTVKPKEELPLSGTDGTFSIDVPYDTLKSYSFFFGHNCSRQPKAIVIAVASQGHDPARKRVDLLHKVRATSDLDYLVHLDPLILTRTTSKH